MKWIQSNGGPLVLISETHFKEWQGAEAEVGTEVTHYDLACSIMQEVAILQVKNFEVLVLGDEPFLTTWIRRQDGGFFIRWIYSNGEQQILDYLHGNDLDDEMQASGVIFPAPGPCILFDSAEPGLDVRGMTLDISLPGGLYDISTGLINPSEDLRLLVHRLRLR